MNVQMQTCMKPDCTEQQTLPCNSCRGVHYCGLLHMVQDFKRHGITECLMLGLHRPCVRCNRKTALSCDSCDETYSERLLAPVAQGAVVTGRALCSTCDQQFHHCPECEAEYLEAYGPEAQPR